MRSEQFWELVDKTTSSPCWIWQGTKDRLGYGRIQMRLDGARVQLAHRAAFIFWYGFHPIDLHHTCETPSCVNPMHLAPLGRAENSRIQRWPERDAAGHLFDSSYVNKRGYLVRKCSICERASKQRYAERKRLERAA